MMPGRVSINFTRLLFTFKCQHQGSLKIEFILHFPTAESNGNPFGSILIAFTYLNNLILLVVACRGVYGCLIFAYVRINLELNTQRQTDQEIRFLKPINPKAPCYDMTSNSIEDSVCRCWGFTDFF